MTLLFETGNVSRKAYISFLKQHVHVEVTFASCSFLLSLDLVAFYVFMSYFWIDFG